MSKTKQFVALVVVVVLAATGFFFFNGDQTPTATPSASQSSSSIVVPDGVSPKAVVFAALLIRNGDIVGAVEGGLVSPLEVELARMALADGTLQEWVDLAEAK